MEFKDIKIWLVDTDHKARPKNPYPKTLPSPHPCVTNFNPEHIDFWNQAKQHVYHCSPSLAGEYKAADVELVWQRHDWLTNTWVNSIKNKAGYTYRQYLQLKQPVKEQELTKPSLAFKIASEMFEANMTNIDISELTEFIQDIINDTSISQL